MKRPRGQHFLFDPGILRKIVACAHISRRDTIVEVGPGLGTLTKILAEGAKKVIAIEIDKKLVARLKERMSQSLNVEVVARDALKYPYENIRGKFKVVANIPYYITTPLLFRLLEVRENISDMTLLLQKEVAKRIVASPGNKEYGVLSITSQLYTRPVIKFTVPKRAFSPPPEVDSAVVYFEVSPSPLFKMRDERLFLDIVRTAFSQRRKTIKNSLKSFQGIRDALQKTGIDPGLRAENLSIEDFIRLSDNLI